MPPLHDVKEDTMTTRKDATTGLAGPRESTER